MLSLNRIHCIIIIHFTYIMFAKFRTFDIHMSVHRNVITNYSQQDATFLEFISTDALRVSGGSSTHHQERTTTYIRYLKLYVQLCAPDDGRRNLLKHAERL